jgi:hypothetical protein
VIYIEGGTKYQKQLAKDLYYFCSQELTIKKPVDIDLRIQDLEHAKAWIDHEGEGKFNIDIEKDLTTDQFITTFCHEMIHVIQYLRDRPISEEEAYQLEVGLAEQFKSLNKS